MPTTTSGKCGADGLTVAFMERRDLLIPTLAGKIQPVVADPQSKRKFFCLAVDPRLQTCLGIALWYRHLIGVKDGLITGINFI